MLEAQLSHDRQSGCVANASSSTTSHSRARGFALASSRSAASTSSMSAAAAETRSSQSDRGNPTSCSSTCRCRSSTGSPSSARSVRTPCRRRCSSPRMTTTHCARSTRRPSTTCSSRSTTRDSRARSTTCGGGFARHATSGVAQQLASLLDRLERTPSDGAAGAWRSPRCPRRRPHGARSVRRDRLRDRGWRLRAGLRRETAAVAPPYHEPDRGCPSRARARADSPLGDREPFPGPHAGSTA